ncbi:MAG TPA: hypothetical protein VHV55_16475 [Pirellulales bacterium]|nr:hypothetical protein [Pirellulales bacterium]
MEAILHRPGTRVAWEREQLQNWLLSPRSAEDGLAEKRQIARKAAAAFRTDFDWSQVLPELSPPQRELLMRNFNELTRVWLLDRADDWLRRPRNRRGQTLDREVRALLDWKLPPAVGDSAAPADTDAARLDRLRADAAVCLADEPAEQRERAFQLLDAARGHVLARGWMRWMPGGG